MSNDPFANGKLFSSNIENRARAKISCGQQRIVSRQSHKFGSEGSLSHINAAINLIMRLVSSELLFLGENYTVLHPKKGSKTKSLLRQFAGIFYVFGQNTENIAREKIANQIFHNGSGPFANSETPPAGGVCYFIANTLA